MLPYWPQLVVFTAAVLCVVLYGLTVSGHFPPEFRDASLQGKDGAIVLWGSMAVAAAADRGPRRGRAGPALVCGGDQCRGDAAVCAAAAAAAARQLRQRPEGVAAVQRGRRAAGRRTDDGVLVTRSGRSCRSQQNEYVCENGVGKRRRVKGATGNR